jgi:hypothetical protein
VEVGIKLIWLFTEITGRTILFAPKDFYICFYYIILVRYLCDKERLPNHLCTVLFHSYIVLVLYLFYTCRYIHVLFFKLLVNVWLLV